MPFTCLTSCAVSPPPQLPVPDPQISITAPEGALLFSGVVYTLICEVTLSRNIDTRINVDIEWEQNASAIIDTNRRNISDTTASNDVTYRSSLMFETLGGPGDGGQYNCTVTVTAAENGEFVGNETAATSHTFSVEGKSKIRRTNFFPAQIKTFHVTFRLRHDIYIMYFILRSTYYC